MVNRELAYRIQMMTAKARGSRTVVVTALLRSGWPKDVVDRDVDQALSWANSYCLTQQQEKVRRQRAARKERVRSDDALDAMFAAAGADPADIPRKATTP